MQQQLRALHGPGTFTTVHEAPLAAEAAEATGAATAHADAYRGDEWEAPVLVPMSQVRTRAVFNLPPDYKFVFLDIIAADGTKWVSPRVPVIQGSALLDFWARVPNSDDAPVQELQVLLHAIVANGVFGQMRMRPLHATLYLKHDEGQQQQRCVWKPHALSLQPYRVLARLNNLARTLSRAFTSRDRLPALSRSQSSAPPSRHYAVPSSNLTRRASPASAWRSPFATFGRSPTLQAPVSSDPSGASLGSPMPAARQTAHRPQPPPTFDNIRSSHVAQTVEQDGGGGGGDAAAAAAASSPDGGPTVSVQQIELVEQHPAAQQQRAEASSGHCSVEFQQPGEPSAHGLSEADVLNISLAGLAVPGAESGPLLLVERCVLSLPLHEADLPELELGTSLSRQLHCYAHGGFMGLAISLLADREWRRLFMDDLGEQSEANKALEAKMLDMRLQKVSSVARKRDLVFMMQLENSPVLCAYGLQRSGCLVASLPVSKVPAPPSTAQPTLASPWWDAERPDVPQYRDRAQSSSSSRQSSEKQGQRRQERLGEQQQAEEREQQQQQQQQQEQSQEQQKQHHQQEKQQDRDSPQPDRPMPFAPGHDRLPRESLPAVLLQERLGLRGSSGLLVNRYGYSPVALEWDLWLDPHAPAELAGANVDHGSPLHLVQQAITMGLGLDSLARTLGQRHNRSVGITPLRWLHSFGSSVNQGAHGGRTRPLPLHCFASPSDALMTAYEDGSQCPSLQSYLQVSFTDLALMVGSSSFGLEHPTLVCRIRLLGNAMSRPPVLIELQRAGSEAGGAVYRAVHGADSGSGGGEGVDVGQSGGRQQPYLYPVHHDIGTSMLVVEVLKSRTAKHVLASTAVCLAPLVHGAATASPVASLQVTQAMLMHEQRVTSIDKLPGRAPISSYEDAVRASPATAAAAATAVPAQHGSMTRSNGLAADVESDGGGEHGRTILDIALAEAERPSSQHVHAPAGAESASSDEHDDPVLARMARVARKLHETAAYSDLRTVDMQALESALLDASSCLDERASPQMQPAKPWSRSSSGAAAPPRPRGGGGACALAMCLSLQRTSVLQAAERLYGLNPAVAQSCIALLSSPGGLYLDVKSGYSDALQLKQFASSLAGIGVHVKAICSFVPAQIDFSHLHDSLPCGGLGSNKHHAPGPSVVSLGAGASQSHKAGSLAAVAASLSPEDSVPNPAFQASASDVTGGLRDDSSAHATPPRLPYDSVLFFHGLNGLELACESGKVAPGTCALFNGASLLLENAENVLRDVRDVASAGSSKTSTSKRRRPLSGASKPTDAGPAGAQSGSKQQRITFTSAAVPDMVDLEAWRRYCTLVQVFQLYGGIYVQEPDASPPSVSALVALVNAHPRHFPLGFAYGHLGSKAVAVEGHTGRGLAAQQLLEELSSRKALSAKVERWIHEGVHIGASDEVYISWGRRLLYRPGLMYTSEQHLLLQLLADYPDEQRLPSVVEEMGGVQALFLRFFEHHEAVNPFTLFELGFNWNHTKALLRLLRNRGVLAALPAEDKTEWGLLLLRGTRGQLAGWMHYLGRGDLHKLAKEALCCLMESCTLTEMVQLSGACGGYRAMQLRLRGWLWLQGWAYERRLKAVMYHLPRQPDEPVYRHSGYGFVKYVRPPAPVSGSWERWWARMWSRAAPISVVDGLHVTVDPRHTRQKHLVYQLVHFLVKVVMCCYTGIWCYCLMCCTGCLWGLYACPKCFYPYCRNRVIPLAAAVALVVLFWFTFISALAIALSHDNGNVVEEVYYGDYFARYNDYQDYGTNVTLDNVRR